MISKNIAKRTKLENGIIIDCKNIDESIYVFIKYNSGNYSIVYNPEIKKGKIIEYGYIRFYTNYVLAKYHYERIKDNAKELKRIKDMNVR